jgi:hypothetical protein
MEGLKEFPFRFGMREHPDLEHARFSYDLWRMLFEHLRVTIHRREPVWWKELLKLWHQAGNVGCLDDKSTRRAYFASVIRRNRHIHVIYMY